MARNQEIRSQQNHVGKSFWKIGKYIRSPVTMEMCLGIVVNQDKILNDEIPGFFEDGLMKCGTYIDDGQRPRRTWNGGIFSAWFRI